MQTFCNDGRNPLLPSEYHIPDVEAHRMPDGRIYLYGSWDQHADNATWCSSEYRVFSTDNLRDWTDHGVSFRTADVPWLSGKISDCEIFNAFDPRDLSPNQKRQYEALQKTYGCRTMDGLREKMGQSDALLYAPDAIYKDGRYYLYFCASDNSEGVAVSERPEGPFSDPVKLPCRGIDPAVFVDDDGTGYYYWGQFRGHGAKLNPDMQGFAEVREKIVTEEEFGMVEGSSMRKIHGLYYLVYACLNANGNATVLAYATSASPLGPFVKRGIIINNEGCDPGCVNNHGSLEQVNGQWYVFYHRSSRNSCLHRRVCAEPVVILEDGSIPEVKMTSQGAGAPFGIGEKIYGRQACGLRGTLFINLERRWGAQDPAPVYGLDKEVLTQISEGDEAVFRYVKPETAVSHLAAEGAGSGRLELYADGKYTGFAEMENGHVTREDVSILPGQYELAIRFSHVRDMEIDWFSLQ